MNKWVSELNRAFTKEEVQMVKKHMKKCPISFTIKEMQMKTTLRLRSCENGYHQEHKQQQYVGKDVGKK
jgi:hypothetical protein